MKSLFIALLMLPTVLFSQDVDLPRNPQPGKCYVKCKVGDGEFYKWKKIDCDVIYFQQLPIENIRSGIYSEEDEKVIKKKLLKYLKKGYTIELKSHYDSNVSDDKNALYSIQKAKLLAGYVFSKDENIETNQIRITAMGNSEPLEKCVNKNNCSKAYYKNTRLEYRAINAN